MPFKNCEFDPAGRPLLKVKTSDGRNVILLETISYIAQDRTEYIAPVGVFSDGASTPPIIWSFLGHEFLPPFGLYWPGTFFHDGAYRGWLLIRDVTSGLRPANLTREQSDNLLLEIMTCLGVPILAKEEIYQGLRAGGSFSFNEDRKREVVASLVKNGSQTVV